MDTIRILVVEDEPGIRKIYKKILSPRQRPDFLAQGASLFGGPDQETRPKKERRYEVTVVEGGMDAIRTVREGVKERRPFAVAFIDLNMPGIDGKESAREICKEDPNIKIVIVSGFMDCGAEHVASEIGKGEIAFLQKPFSREDIEGLVESLAEKWVSESGGLDR